jgi:hypothetical protein
MIYGVRTGGIRISSLGLLGATWREIQRYLSWFWDARFHRNLFEGLAILTCGIWMIAFGDRKDRALVIVWFLVFVMAVCFMANPFGWYLIYVWPLFALWLARCFMAIYETVTSRHVQRRWASICLSLLFVGYLSNLALWAGKAFWGPSYSAIAKELRSIIPKKASVVAGGEWWFALWDRDFTDSSRLQFRLAEAEVNPEARSAGWEHEWRRQHWQFVVAYADLQAMLDSGMPINDAVRFVGVAREREIREARSFAERHCSVIRRIQTVESPVLVLAIH